MITLNRVLIVIMIVVFSMIGYGFFIEPNVLKINEVLIHVDSSDHPLIGKKVLHLTDLHLSQMGKYENQLLDTINHVQPDIIFLTGDYIKWYSDNAPALALFSKLKAKYGVYAVMGDYDYSNSRKSCLFCHEKGTGQPTQMHHVTMLRNRFEKIRMGQSDLIVFGIDGDTEEFQKQYGKIQGKTDSLKIVLSHSPLNFDEFSEDENILMLAGDTHGGQVKLPVWLYRLFGYEKNVKYNYGLFEKGRKTMFVSRGIGTSHLPVRLFSPPEMVILRFENE